MRASLFRQKLKVFPDFVSVNDATFVCWLYARLVAIFQVLFDFFIFLSDILLGLFSQIFSFNMTDNIFSRFPVQLALLQRGNNRRGWKEENNPSAKVRIVMITIITMMITTSIMNFQRKAISSLHHRLRTPPLLSPPHHFITRTGAFT